MKDAAEAKMSVVFLVLFYWWEKTLFLNEPAQAIMVLITLANSEGQASLRIRAVSPEPSLCSKSQASLRIHAV